MNNAGDGGTPKWTGSKKVNLISSVCNNCRSSLGSRSWSFVLRPVRIPFSRRITIADTESTLNHPPSSPPALHIVLQDCRLRNRSFDLSLSHKEISLNNFLRFQVLPASCDRILRSSLLSSAKAAQSGAGAAEKLKL